MVMALLDRPPKGLADLAAHEARVPDPEEIPILGQRYLACTIKVGEALKGMKAMWAVAGNAALVMHGVAVEPDRLEVVTTKEGVGEVFERLSQYSRAAPALSERRLERDAEVKGVHYPVLVRSLYGELDVDGVKVEVFGEKQFKVGDWEWGDPLDFRPDLIQVVSTDVRVVPLRVESQISFALGWTDLALKIADAIDHQTHGPRVVPGSMEQ